MGSNVTALGVMSVGTFFWDLVVDGIDAAAANTVLQPITRNCENSRDTVSNQTRLTLQDLG
jgi:hypothetical protein